MAISCPVFVVVDKTILSSGFNVLIFFTSSSTALTSPTETACIKIVRLFLSRLLNL